jgi:hypothetical protein
MEVPIVGRDDELAQARAALVAASGGAGRLVLVSGEHRALAARRSAGAVRLAA